MKITDQDVTYVADLANLELTDEERMHMVRDLNSILGYIDMLNRLNTDKVEPMAQVADRYGVDTVEGRERSLRLCQSRGCAVWPASLSAP